MKIADIIPQIPLSIKQDLNIISYPYFKKVVLNFLFRQSCFVNRKNKIRNVTQKDMVKIERHTNFSHQLVSHIVRNFIVNAQNLKKFFASKPITREYDRAKLAKKLRIYLHKLHRIAPVFSYKRAMENLKIFHQLLEQKNYWPHITTQLALVIFITDRNDKTNEQGGYIIQKSLRAFCDCSAYAFHRARNILQINTRGKTY
ncbi:MAG: hypothetical protein P8Y23_13315 [Candidatus Lokiarchaeota archaeon]